MALALVDYGSSDDDEVEDDDNDAGSILAERCAGKVSKPGHEKTRTEAQFELEVTRTSISTSGYDSSRTSIGPSSVVSTNCKSGFSGVDSTSTDLMRHRVQNSAVDNHIANDVTLRPRVLAEHSSNNKENGVVSSTNLTEGNVDQISDDDDDIDPSVSSSSDVQNMDGGGEEPGPRPMKFSLLSNIPPPKYATSENIDLPNNSSSVLKGGQDETLSLSELPAPKPKNTSMLQGYEDDVVEDIYKKKESPQEVPKPMKKGRQPVKITIPSLADLDSDEDEDPDSKKPKPTRGHGSGLLSMLPKPKHKVVKEMNRPLIPYTLARKSTSTKITDSVESEQQPSAPSTTSGKRSKLPGVPDSDSEEEDIDSENVNFFSFNDNASDSVSSSTQIRSVSAASSSEQFLTPTVMPVSSIQSHSVLSSSTHLYQQKSLPKEAASSSSVSSSVSSQDAGHSSSAVGLEDPHYSYHAASLDHEAPAAAFPGQECEYIQQSNVSGSDQFEGFTNQQRYPDDGANRHGVENFLQDEEFNKMRGKRFKDEMINIIDVNADDQMNTVDLTKNLTEEVSGFSYSKKRKKDMPSSLERRKHQITYLAHQAKEREIELKNQWSQNRQTKKQTQAKYGF